MTNTNLKFWFQQKYTRWILQLYFIPPFRTIMKQLSIGFVSCTECKETLPLLSMYIVSIISHFPSFFYPLCHYYYRYWWVVTIIRYAKGHQTYSFLSPQKNCYFKFQNNPTNSVLGSPKKIGYNKRSDGNNNNLRTSYIFHCQILNRPCIYTDWLLLLFCEKWEMLRDRHNMRIMWIRSWWATADVKCLLACSMTKFKTNGSSLQNDGWWVSNHNDDDDHIPTDDIFSLCPSTTTLHGQMMFRLISSKKLKGIPSDKQWI